jgi:hypothetical protein
MVQEFSTVHILDVDTVTIQLDAPRAIVTTGATGRERAAFKIKSDLDGRSDRFEANVAGEVLAGGRRAHGRLVLLNGTGDLASREGAGVVIEAEEGTLELAVIGPDSRQVTVRLSAADAVAQIGGEGIAGRIILLSNEERVRIDLNAVQALIRAGGTGADGALVLADELGKSRIHLDAEHAVLRLGTPAPTPEDPGGLTATPGAEPQIITVEARGEESGSLSLRHGNIEMVRLEARNGRFQLNDEQGVDSISLDGEKAELRLGNASGSFGTVTVRNREGTSTVSINGQSGQLSAETVRVRQIIAIDDSGQGTLQIDGTDATITAGFAAAGKAGKILVNDAEQQPVFEVDGEKAEVRIGRAPGRFGILEVENRDGTSTVSVNGQSGRVSAETSRVREVIGIDAGGKSTLHFDGKTATITAGFAEGGKAGKIIVNDANQQPTIELDGSKGDVMLVGADCAEEFEVSNAEACDPGTVLVIGHDAVLEASCGPYDRRVAGVVSGAGDLRPGIVLGHERGRGDSRVAIALAGRTYCKADATSQPIVAGDLLTTAAVGGHAMRAGDDIKASGAVLGKALAGLDSGRGLIPILVALG